MATPQNNQIGQPYIAAGLLKSGSGVLQKVACASSTAGALTVYDNTTATGTPIINAFPLTAGQVYEFNAAFSAGCFVVIGGAATYTITLGP